jgi:hypothetical protein
MLDLHALDAHITGGWGEGLYAPEEPELEGGQVNDDYEPVSAGVEAEIETTWPDGSPMHELGRGERAEDRVKAAYVEAARELGFGVLGGTET